MKMTLRMISKVTHQKKKMLKRTARLPNNEIQVLKNHHLQQVIDQKVTPVILAQMTIIQNPLNHQLNQINMMTMMMMKIIIQKRHLIQVVL
jgi:hypothetical protein